MAASGLVADVLEVTVPIGGRVLVVGALDLSGAPRRQRGSTTAALAQAIESWTGPGVLIFNGGALHHSSPRLVDAALAFAAGPCRRVLYLVESRDRLTSSGMDTTAALLSSLGAEVGLAAELEIETGAGRRVVRVEPGATSSCLADGEHPDGPAHSRAKELVTAGRSGLITAHIGDPELTRLGEGFLANTGAIDEEAAETRRQVAWVELEAGNELHVRLLRDRLDRRGGSGIRRLLTRLSPNRVAGQTAEVAATFQPGASWPAGVDVAVRLRRIRRISASLVAFASILSMVSAFSEPFRHRLQTLLEFVPLAVPQAANAVVALASLSLLLLARAIRRGQRRAWLICEGLLIAAAILHVVKGVDLEEALVAGGVALFLFINRSAFQANVDRPSARRGLQTLLVGAAVAVLSGTVGVELGTRFSRGRHHQRLPVPTAFLASVERLVGVRIIVLPDRLDDFFAPAMVAVAVGLVVAAVWLFFRPVVARHAGTAGPGEFGGGLAQAREVVRRFGSGTLDYFALRSEKRFFFRRNSLVAYGVYGSVCLVSPDPIGPPAEREEIWEAFHRFADANGWTVGVLGAGEDWLPIYRASGMQDLYVGDEAVVNCRRFTLEGGRHKSLRQAVNRIAKYGYTITFHDPARIAPSLRTSLEAVMTKSRRGDVERGFSMTLGRAFDPHDEGLLLAVVHGPADTGPVAFCQYVPAPGIDGYSLDLMRRDDGVHPNGLMDFAIVETIRWLRAHNRQGLGLNFATMRAVLAGEAGDGLSQRVQAWCLRRMSDSMQIESLWKFNAKYDPEWQPRWALYDAPEHALPAAFAVARAESFWELPVIGRFLVPATPSPTALEPTALERAGERAGESALQDEGSLVPAGRQ